MSVKPEDIDDKPKPDTASNVHEVVLNLLKNEKRGKLLDLGAGEGALSKGLLEIYFDVECCDFNPERFKIGKKCEKVDLNKPLPYKDETYDFVMCVEVIEHLQNPWLIISECKRILKKNGKLVITTPNILSVSSRIHFLFRGEHAWFPNRQLYEPSKDLYETLDRHINPISFHEMEHILRENGFIIDKIAANTYFHGNLSSQLGFMTRLLSPLIKRQMKKKFDQIILNSDELLFGEILILKAQKL